MTRSNTRVFWVFLLGFACGTFGETMLWMRAQCVRVESMLLEDFRVLAFLTSDLPESKGKILEEKVRALPGTAQARYISRDAAMQTLQEQDPELVKSVTLLGENPLNPALEIQPRPETVGEWPIWIASISKLPEVAETRFKPMEFNAILQAQWVLRFLNLAMSLTAFAWCLGVFVRLWAVIGRRGSSRLMQRLGWRLAYAASGTGTGMGVIFLAARPFHISAAGSGPSWESQALLALTGIVGAGLLTGWGWSLADRSPVRRAEPKLEGEAGPEEGVEPPSEVVNPACENREPVA